MNVELEIKASDKDYKHSVADGGTISVQKQHLTFPPLNSDTNQSLRRSVLPTGEVEGGGPARQGLWADTVGVGAHVVVSSLLLVNLDGAPGRTHDAPEEEKGQCQKTLNVLNELKKRE